MTDLAMMSFDDVIYLNELLDGYEAAYARMQRQARGAAGAGP